MGKYVVRRLLHTLAVVFVLATLVFFLVRLGGDPVQMLLPPDATQQQVEELRARLGLSEPLLVQYVRFLRAAAAGDLGIAFYYGEPALRVVLARLPATLELVAGAMLIAAVLSIVLGVYSATHRGRLGDRVVLIGSLIGVSSPPFFVGIMLMILFSLNLKWLPSSGRGGIEHLILPCVTLALFRIAAGIRLVRASMLEVIREDFIRTARAKGLAEWAVMYKHALKNTLLPFITLFGLQTGAVLAGAVATETIFAWPGMGRLLILAVQQMDYPVIIAYAIVVAVAFSIINLLVDILYAYLDPRIRYD